jgi:hypothetical protein
MKVLLQYGYYVSRPLLTKLVEEVVDSWRAQDENRTVSHSTVPNTNRSSVDDQSEDSISAHSEDSDQRLTSDVENINSDLAPYDSASESSNSEENDTDNPYSSDCIPNIDDLYNSSSTATADTPINAIFNTRQNTHLGNAWVAGSQLCSLYYASVISDPEVYHLELASKIDALNYYLNILTPDRLKCSFKLHLLFHVH